MPLTAAEQAILANPLSTQAQVEGVIDSVNFDDAAACTAALATAHIGLMNGVRTRTLAGLTDNPRELDTIISFAAFNDGLACNAALNNLNPGIADNINPASAIKLASLADNQIDLMQIIALNSFTAAACEVALHNAAIGGIDQASKNRMLAISVKSSDHGLPMLKANPVIFGNAITHLNQHDKADLAKAVINSNDTKLRDQILAAAPELKATMGAASRGKR